MTSRATRRRRAGMTLVEVIVALVIMTGAMFGLANFVRKYQHATQDASNITLASDLATQRIEEIKGDRSYTTLVATYNGTSTTYTDVLYKGFTRATAAVRTGPNSTNDYVTVTVTVTRNNMTNPMKKTTIIAAF
jgi:prepilin-type N-terminal cleavage/methylation domain-containing protein